MNMKTGVLLLAALWLVACNSHVQEPWVPYPGYLKQERSRNPALNQRLEHRVYHQMDR